MNIGEMKVFSYTGGMQSFTIPEDGLYKLTVSGATGAAGTESSGGKGGFSYGYKSFTKGTVIYICVGGQSSYNGGGSRGTWGYQQGGVGGGASHMALVSGTIESIGKSTFDSKGLIVAGGGGGGSGEGGSVTGGIGGGTSGGSPGASNNYGSSGGGGTQTSGGSSGGRSSAGYFGHGGNNNTSDVSGGGGGGYYGGGGGSLCGGGGSGWIQGVPSIKFNGITYSSTTTAGAGTLSNGEATITFIARPSITKIGSTNITKVLFNSKQITTWKRG